MHATSQFLSAEDGYRMYRTVQGEDPLRIDRITGLSADEIVMKCREIEVWRARKGPHEREIISQGVNLICHTDPVYWRIERQAAQLSSEARFLAPGDAVKMCHDFAGAEAIRASQLSAAQILDMYRMRFKVFEARGDFDPIRT